MPKDGSEEDYVMDDLEGNIDITIINVEETNEEIKQDVEIEIVNNDENELVSHIETITNDSDKKEDILEYINNATNNSDTSDETETADTADATETASITSEIIFNNEDDKALSRKYNAMNLEKLREECKNNSLNTEGTKSILISRIIENIKKQK